MPPQVPAYLGTATLLLAYFGLGTHAGRRAARKLYQTAGDLTPLLLFVPYLLAAGFHTPPGDLVRFGVGIYLPLLFFRQVKTYDRFSLWMALTLLTVWFPLEPELFLLPLGKAAVTWAHWLSMPSVQAPLAAGVTLPLAKLSMVVMVLYLFTVRRPLEGVGFTWQLSRADWHAGLTNLAIFSLVGIPVGLLMGFLHFHLAAVSALKVVLAAAGMYFFVALPEEILFRGVLQNLLQRHWKTRPWLGLFVAALIFGLAHIDNATPGFPVPNLAYVLMATIAGLVYGNAWAQRRKATASAITHTGVNLLWMLLFR